MILHLLFDDVFGDYAIRQFSGKEMCSEFVVISDSSNCSYIKEPVHVIIKESKEFYNLQTRLGEYRSVIFHGLFYPWQAVLLQAVPIHVKIAWVFFGGDIYGRADLRSRFLSPRSKVLLTLQSFKRIVRGVPLSTRYDIPLDLLKRIDYCLTDVPEDFAFIQRYFGTPIKELWYNYYSIEETIGELVEEVVNDNNVLIGNGCTIECNHLDGFKKLLAFPLSDSKVIVPLSHGESWLRSILVRIGRRCFGGNFQPLVEFMPRNEYNAIIKSCSVAIMPHYRPQAFGNILTALWLGTRVYMSQKSLLYRYFKRIGAVVFTIEDDLKRENPLALQALSQKETNHNRTVISAIYSKETMRKKNLELVRVLNQ